MPIHRSRNRFERDLDAKELLLADYRYLCDSFWRNEEMGERRVTILTTIVAAVIAAIAALLEKKTGQDNGAVLAISIFASGALFVLGLVTLLRIVKRNETTDGYKKDMDDIRRRFREHFDGDEVLKDYQPFRSPSRRHSAIRRIGGLAHLVAALNGIVLSAMSCLIVLLLDTYVGLGPWLSLFFGFNALLPMLAVLAALIFLGAFIGQSRYVADRDRETKEKLWPEQGR
jgi:hypothetical protein